MSLSIISSCVVAKFYNFSYLTFYYAVQAFFTGTLYNGESLTVIDTLPFHASRYLNNNQCLATVLSKQHYYLFLNNETCYLNSTGTF